MNATTIRCFSRIRKLRGSRAGSFGILVALAAGLAISSLLLLPPAQSAAVHEIADAGRILGLVNLWVLAVCVVLIRGTQMVKSP